MVKSALFHFAFVLLSLVSFTNAQAAPADDQMIVLRAGTPITVTLNQTVSSANAQVGNTVEFMVRNDVVVNGKIVIAAGAMAEGWVKNVQRACPGSPARLVITVESAQAVDGSRVFLQSIPFTVQGQPQSQAPAQARIGTNLSARTRNDARINA